MSKKANKKRQAYARKQEKQGQNVVRWIFVGTDPACHRYVLSPAP